MKTTPLQDIKTEHMDRLADYVQQLYAAPQLRHLFLELTLQCNEHCFHCGSNAARALPDELTAAEYRRILREVREDFDITRMMLCITGGEPMLRPDFFEIMADAHALGYRWGMTSNATLIGRDEAHRLADCGMGTISVSIDGLPQTHDRLRGLTGGFDLAMRGVQNLIDENAFNAVQITTVINHRNIEELDALFDIMDGIDIDSWRVIGLEPIGRALSRPDLMLTPEDWRRLMSFIREKRQAGYPVEYGCSHYLGLDYEREVRPWYFLCNAGVYTAGIMTNGDIGACLDIERRPELIQGNVRRDRFSAVWNGRFELFRQDPADLTPVCRDCAHRRFCRGGAWHSKNFDTFEPLVCLKDILF